MFKRMIILAIALCLVGLFSVPALSAGFPDGSSFPYAGSGGSGPNWGADDFKVVSVDKAAKTVTVLLPIDPRQRDTGRSWKVYTRQGTVGKNGRWHWCAQSKEAFGNTVQSVARDGNFLKVTVKAFPDSDSNGQYRIRFWGNSPGMTGDNAWMWTRADSAWGVKDAREGAEGVIGYELLVDFNDGSVYKVGPNFAPDIYKP